MTDIKPLDTSAPLDVAPLVVSDARALAAEQLEGVDELVATVEKVPVSGSTVTVCILCSDDHYERYLTECLEALPAHVDIVVLRNRRGDTETITQTSCEVLLGNVAYYDWTWTGLRFNFGRARNIVSRLASTEWLLHLDADERVYEHARLTALCDVLPEEVGGAHCTMVWHQYHGRGRALNDRRGVFPALRLVRNRHDIFWCWCIHEQAVPSIGMAGLEIVDTRLCIIHDGYVCEADELVAKGERNLEALAHQRSLTPCEFLDMKVEHENVQMALIRQERGN